jgi:aminopeptidase-like protein
MNRFRATIGSDEYVFNDPKIGIPGLMLTRYPYPEYHTSADTPKIIKEDKIKGIQQIIKNIIEIYEKDYIPVRNFKAPLFRSKYNVQTPVHNLNLAMDYLIYGIDGRYLSEIVDGCEMNWKFSYDLFEKLVKDKLITKKYESGRIDASKKGKSAA